ncbi:hypothetical protein [Roseateles sp.]|uniref:hypothetical protein n=1 Tax=Roseateles sp. TaxID=1971397 RepID=UPI0031D494D2
MSAVLQPIEPFMPRVDFHVQIDEQIKARVEALASRLTIDMDELVEFLVKRWVERTDPDEPDVTLHEVLMERRLDNGVKAALRGDLVPEEEIEAEDAQMMADIRRRQERGG